MSYYHELSILKITDVGHKPVTGSEMSELIEEMGAINENFGIVFQDDDGSSHFYTNSWRDRDCDMCEVSEEYPELVLVVSRFSEHPQSDSLSEDLSRTYYCNGRMQYCPAQVTFADFDVRKLLEPTL